VAGDFYFSTLTTSSIDPTNYLFFTGGFFLGVTRPPLETYPFVLSSSELKMRGTVLPQF